MNPEYEEQLAELGKLAVESVQSVEDSQVIANFLASAAQTSSESIRDLGIALNKMGKDTLADDDFEMPAFDSPEDPVTLNDMIILNKALTEPHTLTQEEQRQLEIIKKKDPPSWSYVSGLLPEGIPYEHIAEHLPNVQLAFSNINQDSDFPPFTMKHFVDVLAQFQKQQNEAGNPVALEQQDLEVAWDGLFPVLQVPISTDLKRLRPLSSIPSGRVRTRKYEHKKRLKKKSRKAQKQARRNNR